MKILYYSGFHPYWGAYSPDVLEREDCMIGGGEAAFLMTAAALADRGHEVLALHPGREGSWRGVQFRDRSCYEQVLLADQEWDAVVSWTDPRPLCSPAVPAGAARLLPQQLNDLAAGVDGVDAVISPSWTHAEFLKREYGVVDTKFYVCHSGVTCEYKQAFVWPRDPIVGYWSSPDRGLIHLLRVWPKVKKAVPKARLWVFYEIRKWLEMSRGAYGYRTPYQGWYTYQAEAVNRLLTDCAAFGVELFGAIPRKKLAKYQQLCRVWCYPLDNGAGMVEGFSVATLEALAAGCWPITSPVDALPEIYADAVCDWVLRGNVAELEAKLIERLLHPPEQEAFLGKNLAVAAKYTWAKAGKQMEFAIKDTLRLKHNGSREMVWEACEEANSLGATNA